MGVYDSHFYWQKEKSHEATLQQRNGQLNCPAQMCYLHYIIICAKIMVSAKTRAHQNWCAFEHLATLAEVKCNSTFRGQYACNPSKQNKRLHGHG